ncbi:MAG: argininosuccinate lyase [Gemmatimonadetes bacterium]|nr:argininosuccinate lyase [Gemmatimonadota bacterium]
MATPPSPPETTHRLWGGRFGAKSAPELDAYNRSIGTDFRLWPFDVQLSKAWALALRDAGVLSADEASTLRQGLDGVAGRLAAGAQPTATDEDIHTMIDRLLHAEVGDVAGKLHTGRSRNDQVATATRLWVIDACAKLDAAVRGLQRVLLDHATALERDGVLMPAYTHLQRAQPVAAAHWMLSHFWPLERDRGRLAQAARQASSLPLGSGAIAGSAFPVSRPQLRELLGFATVAPNSMDAVGDRDFIADLLYALTLHAVHVSRLAEDLILYGTSEFGFVKFGDAYSTGSSMMPQKRNPDVLEIARGGPARVLGDLTGLLVTLKGLPSGYNKDLQDDKRALFDAVDVVLTMLPAVSGAVAELRFDAARMRAALSSAMMATDLADWLVDQGIAFREAHGAVGRVVRAAEERGVELNALPAEVLASGHALFTTASVAAALSPDASVNRRAVAGGTAFSSVRAQLMQARDAIGAGASSASG